MKTLILTILMYTAIVSCKAQQNYPLNTDYENIPNNSYLKDTNNELVPYLGIYKANFQGNEITLFITKEENKLTNRVNKQFYRDVLIVKYIIRNSSGLILQDTQNMNFQPEPKYYTIYSMITRPALGDIVG